MSHGRRGAGARLETPHPELVLDAVLRVHVLHDRVQELPQRRQVLALGHLTHHGVPSSTVKLFVVPHDARSGCHSTLRHRSPCLQAPPHVPSNAEYSCDATGHGVVTCGMPTFKPDMLSGAWFHSLSRAAEPMRTRGPGPGCGSVCLRFRPAGTLALVSERVVALEHAQLVSGHCACVSGQGRLSTKNKEDGTVLDTGAMAQSSCNLHCLPADWAAGGTTGAGGGVYGGRSKGMHVSFFGPRPSFFHIDQCVSPASTCTRVGKITTQMWNCHARSQRTICINTLTSGWASAVQHDVVTCCHYVAAKQTDERTVHAPCGQRLQSLRPARASLPGTCKALPPLQLPPRPAGVS